MRERISSCERGRPDDCWFCVWDGFGGMDDQDVQERVELPQRSYFLARGSIDDALSSTLDAPRDQSPNLWWPEDRAWVVASEIDFAWTYVAASAKVVAALVADQRLEAMEASFAHICESPKDSGVLRLIVRRPAVSAREIMEQGELTLADGLVGDGWSARGSRRP